MKPIKTAEQAKAAGADFFLKRGSTIQYGRFNSLGDALDHVMKVSKPGAEITIFSLEHLTQQ